VGDRVEVTSGLTASDVMAVSNLARLSDGTEIAK
jgi:hypothetical protein